MNPTVVFGMTLHNNARHLPAALESLLAQTDRDFGLVMVDDGSVDATGDVARAFLARDSRLRHVRFGTRRGMVAAWRQAFETARMEFPHAAYFAWASDHDWWHPDWLRRVRAALDSCDDCVLAHALTQRVDDELRPLDKPPKAFDTTGLADPAARVRAFASEPAGAGDMVYGLMRVGALERAGVFRPVLQPDRLLMVELAIAGRFAQVPEVLWLRRQPARASIEKQATSLFADGGPSGIGMPVWMQHSRVLLREYVTARPSLTRETRNLKPETPGGLAMIGLILQYQFLYLLRGAMKQGQVLHRMREGYERGLQALKDGRYVVRWAWYRTRTRLHPIYVGRVIRKHVMHVVHRAIYHAAVARRRARALWYEVSQDVRKQYGRVRRGLKRARYEVLVLTHRLGLRGR